MMANQQHVDRGSLATTPLLGLTCSPAVEGRPGAMSQPRGSSIVRSSGIAAAVQGDTTVLVDMHSGRRYILTGFGSRVWSLLACQPVFPALVEGLRDDGTRAEQLAEDIARLVVTWQELGLIGWR